jgi:16S rRNA (guanine527-N7)-methyltransferase
MQYLSLLARWNRIHNLTAIDEPIDMVKLHLLDSLSIVKPIVDSGCETLIDIGSGAGLPGIVLSVVCPQLRITSVDSVAKKISFQAQVKAELKLDGFTPTQSRIEQLRVPKKFDAAICRAYSSIDKFIADSERLVQQGGPLFAMKGEVPMGEIAAAEKQGFSSRVMPLKVPGLLADRCLITLRKN